MKRALIGYTGFVGSNLALQIKFDDLYNSKNIQLIEGQTYDEVYCAGVRAQKWLANAHPEEDLERIKDLINHLEHAKIGRFILISTIDVYPQPNQVYEHDEIDELQQSAYGSNRYFLEKWVESHFDDFLIIRLPGLFGYNLKKNFIYDMMHPLPNLLNQKTIEMLFNKMSNDHKQGILNEYQLQGVDYVFSGHNRELVREIFDQYNFSSLFFTDSQDTFQYYDLRRLSQDIKVCESNRIKLINFAAEPVTAEEVYEFVYAKQFKNTLERNKQFYNFYTSYASYFESNSNYLMNKSEVLERIKDFVQEVSD